MFTWGSLGFLISSLFNQLYLICPPILQLNVLRMLPSLASHSSMVPLVIQTILPLLRKGGNSYVFAAVSTLENFSLTDFCSVKFLDSCMLSESGELTVSIRIGNSLRVWLLEELTCSCIYTVIAVVQVFSVKDAPLLKHF